MIYITGDMHGDKKRFQQVRKAGIRKGDTLLVCGDFGFLWNGGRQEEKLLKWIGRRSYQVLFVDGCNENHELLRSYPVSEQYGGKVRQISGRLFALMRGEIYQIDGKSVFAFGGGDSNERFAGTQQDSFLLPSPEELENAREQLKKHNYKVDLIISHDAPAKIRSFLDMNTTSELTHLHTFLEEISQTVSFREWYFGKYHANRRIPPRYYMVFTAVRRFEG